MKDRAYAKINLSLDITRRRGDGYHELNSIMLPINLWDELEITKSNKDEYFCNIKIPFDEKNTIVKAINYIKETYKINDNFKVTLNKRIPSQAGLGGGSSDGASAIRILNKMYSLDLTKEEIQKACLAVGSDVLFTYYNKPAIIKGIGEIIEPIEVKDDMNVLLVKPKAGVSTKESYQNLNLNTCCHPNIEELRKRLASGDEYQELLGNSLEEPSFNLCPIIKSIKDELKESGYNYPLMSGSGSTVFVLSNNENELIELKNKIIKKYSFVYVTKIKKA